jgi:putative endonuclease
VGRVFQHKNKTNEGFTKKYGVDNLVYFESTTDANAAIAREKQLKHWKREWKLALIEKENPSWTDLYPKMISGSSHAQG